jgi:hypothetical protein
MEQEWSAERERVVRQWEDEHRRYQIPKCEPDLSAEYDFATEFAGIVDHYDDPCGEGRRDLLWLVLLFASMVAFWAVVGALIARW